MITAVIITLYVLFSLFVFCLGLLLKILCVKNKIRDKSGIEYSIDIIEDFPLRLFVSVLPIFNIVLLGATIFSEGFDLFGLSFHKINNSITDKIRNK